MKLNKDIYSNKSELRESMQRLLIPSKDAILELKSGQSGPHKLSKSQAKIKQTRDEWSSRVNLETISENKMMDLVDFYNSQLSKVKFTRNSISLIKSNSKKNLHNNVNMFERTDPL